MTTTCPPRVTVLSGGLGGARLALAASEAGVEHRSTFVTNVADDWMVGDLPVCPDTDAVVYALSGRFDAERGWGVLGDSFPGPRAGEPSWFGIGTLDRSTHERRRDHLRSGRSIADATAQLVAQAGVRATVIPSTCDRVRTRLRTGGRWAAFQEWMVRDGGPPVDEVRWDGLARARPAPGVLEAIDAADLVVLASSSPVASLAPILGLPGVREGLRRRTAPTVALSPVVLGRPATTDRDRHREHARRSLMAAVGIEHSPAGVAEWLASSVSHVAIDPCDAEFAPRISRTGAQVIEAPVIGIDADERAALMGVLGRLATVSPVAAG